MAVNTKKAILYLHRESDVGGRLSHIMMMTDLEYRHFIRQVKLVMSTSNGWCCQWCRSITLAGSYVLVLKLRDIWLQRPVGVM